MPASKLIDDLWGDDPPATAAHTLETYVSRIRQALRGAAIDGLQTRPPGYVLVAEPEDVDVLCFEALVAAADTAVERLDVDEAAELLASALAIWRGPALADVLEVPFAAAAAQRLEDRRLVALEKRIDADLRVGRHRELTSELESLTAADPYREPFHRQLILALYRSGRQAESLAAYRRARDVLADQLGIEPGPELRAMQGRVLRQDPALDSPPRPGPSVERRPVRALGEGAVDTARPGRPRAAPRTLRTRAAIAGAIAVGLALAAVVVPVVARRAGSGVVIPANGVAVLDVRGDDLVVSASLGLNGPPGQVIGGEGSVWVSSPEAHAVYRIDPTQRAVVQTIPVGAGSDGLAVGAGAAWVANALDGTVSRIDPATNQVVDSIVVGSRPSGLAFGEGAVWVADPIAATLMRIDPDTDRPERIAGLDMAPFGVAVGSHAIWATSASSNRVLSIDPGTNGLTQSTGVGAGPVAVAVGYGAVWVANSRDSTVSQIDPATGSVVSTIPVGEGPSGIAVGAGGVWVSSALAGTVTQIDPVLGRAVRSVDIGGRPGSVAVVDDEVWVTIRPAPTAKRSGGTIRVESFNLTSIDPSRLWPTSPFQLWAYTYDTLVTYQRVGGSEGSLLVPDLAVAVPLPTAGGTTYTFVIRPGIRYSDGSPVRAADFRYAIERTLELNDEGAGAFLRGIVGAAACSTGPSACDLSDGIVVDQAARTVTFHLLEPDPDFLYKLTLPFASPVPSTTPRADVGRSPVPGTGPYVFASYVPGRSLTLARNPMFQQWSAAAQPDGYPDRIEWTFGTSGEHAISSVERGDADWTPIPPVDADDIAVRYASRVFVEPSLTTLFFFLNTRAPPFDDVRVRRALNLAIDRRVAVDIMGGPRSALPACQLLPPGMPGYRPYCPYTVHPDAAGTWIAPDVTRARALVKASGTGGMPVTVWASDLEPSYRPLAHYVGSVLERLGYRSSVRLLPHDRWASIVGDSRRRVQLGTNAWTADFPSPTNFYDFFLACSSFVPGDPAHTSNGSEFCEPAIDRQVAEAAKLHAIDPLEASALWEEVGRRITNLAPVLPLVHVRSVSFVSDRVANYQYNPVWGILLDQLWIANERSTAR